MIVVKQTYGLAGLYSTVTVELHCTSDLYSTVTAKATFLAILHGYLPKLRHLTPRPSPQTAARNVA